MVKNELIAEGIIKYVGKQELLTDCYLKCETGNIIGLLGRNGAGKSTLLKIIFGITSAYNKNIRVNQQRYDAAYKHGNLIAYLPQHPFLPGGLTLQRTIDIFISRQDARNNILHDQRIKPLLHQRIKTLSGGERKYFEILLLVHLDVKFVLLDEPFADVEPLYKETIIDLLHQHRSEKGFIITDHDYTNIIRASSQILLITNGICKKINDLKELEFWHYAPPGTFSS